MQQLVKKQGCAVLMVTHNNRILDIADRIVHLEDGQLVTSERVTDVSQISFIKIY